MGCFRWQLRELCPGGEYQDWVRYYNAEPFGTAREEQRFGSIMAALSALNANAKKAHLDPSHWAYSPPKEHDDDEMIAMMMAGMPRARPK